MTDQPSVARASTYQHDGLTLAYAVVGDGPQPILFVHGATATGEFEWAGLAAALGPGYRCILPDLRGHGRSEFRATETWGWRSVRTCITSSTTWSWGARTSWVSPTARRSR